MNFYPSWIHRIPEMLEALALLPDERIDRRRAEELFDLRRSAAHELLRRLGAERCGNALAISRSTLIARLREAQEHPGWRWERERREQIRARIDTLRPDKRRSLVPVGGVPTADRSDLDRWLAGHGAVCGRQTGHPLPRHGTFGGTIGFGGEGARHRLRSHATSGRKRTLAPSSLLRARCCTIQFASGLMSRDPNRFELPKKRENSSSGST